MRCIAAQSREHHSRRTASLMTLKRVLFAGVLVWGAPGVHAQMRPPTIPALIDLEDTSYPIPPTGAYYVAVNGSAGNTGRSPSSPWPAVHALNNAPVGATLVFRGGEYRGVNFVRPARRLILQPYPHEPVWFKGSVVVSGWTSESNVRGAIWSKAGWTHQFPPNVGPEYIDSDYPLAGFRDMVFVNNQPLVQVGTRDAVGPGTFFVDYGADKLYIGDDPAGKTVESTAYTRALHLEDDATHNPTGTVVRGLGFTHYADDGLAVHCPNVVLENNTFAWNGQQGAGGGGPTNLILRGNTFSCNGRKGFSASGAHGLLADGNTFTYNNVEIFDRGWDAAGIKIVRSRDFTIRSSFVRRNFSNGIWIDMSCARATIVYNWCRSSEGSGVFVELSHDTIVAFNVSFDHRYGAGVAVWDSSDVRVFNNTLSKNGHALDVTDTPRANDNAAEIAAGITWVNRNLVFKNNLFSNTSTNSDGPLVDASNCSPRFTGEPAALMISAMNTNGYHRTSSSAPTRLIGWSLGPSASQCGAGYNTLPLFRAAHPGYEAGGLSIDNQNVNPFFWGEANEDFRLRPGSPALFRGEALAADVALAAGWPAGLTGPVHLGALGEAIASAPLYRLDYAGTYFFLTANPDEHNFLVSVGWTSRGAQGRLYGEAGGSPDLVALFRLYYPSNGDHFYTTNVAERNAAVSGGYLYEGVAGFVLTQAGPSRRALYRAYNPSTGQHRFTGDAAEYNALPSPWIKEGVAAYLVAAP